MYTIKWTPEDRIHLLLAELRSLEQTQPDEYEMLDFETLPSAPTPPDVNMEYPIWAMDIYGFCLVGEDAAAIEHLDEIRTWYAAQSARQG
jgi:hypothetical protein